MAVTAVVLYHAFPSILPGGFVGVDIFFVISGYLITSILLRDLEINSFSLLSFFGRRMRRIVPALIVMFVCVMLFGWLVLLTGEYVDLSKQVIAGSTFISNLLYWRQTGYFDTLSESKPLLHLWSLAIEEQFYFIWPIALKFFHKRGSSLLTVLMTIILLSFGLEILAMKSHPVAAFYLLPTRLWELICGALIAKIDLSYREKIFSFLQAPLFWAKFNPMGASFTLNEIVKNRLTEQLISIVGLSLIFLGIVLTDKNTFPSYWPLLPVLGTMLYIFAGGGAFFNKQFFSLKPIVFLGLISYPLYLFHWPLLSFGFIVESGVPSAIIRLGLVLTSVVLAVFTYFFVERPIQKSFKTIDTSRLKLRLILCGIFGLTVCALFGSTIYLNDGFPDRAAGKLYSDEVGSYLEGPAWKYIKNDICLKRYSFPNANNYGWWFCIQNRDEPPTVLLLGDSYANHLYPGVIKNPSLSHHVVLSIGACGYEEMGGTVKSEKKADSSPCSGNRPIENANFINAILEREKSLKYVLLAGSSSDDSEANILAKSKRIAQLEKLGKNVILFSEHPVGAGITPMSCYPRVFSTKKKSICEFTWAEKSTQSFSEKILKIHPEVVFFNPVFAFNCDSRLQKCSFQHNGLPMYRDQYFHLSEYGSVRVIDKFVEDLRNVNQQLLLKLEAKGK